MHCVRTEPGRGGGFPEIRGKVPVDEAVKFPFQERIVRLADLGKKRGGDLAEGKKTLIMIHALANGVKVDVFGRKDATPEEIEKALIILEKSGSIEYARLRAVELVERGKQALDVLPDTPARAILLELADYMISRGY